MGEGKAITYAVGIWLMISLSIIILVLANRSRSPEPPPPQKETKAAPEETKKAPDLPKPPPLPLPKPSMHVLRLTMPPQPAIVQTEKLLIGNWCATGGVSGQWDQHFRKAVHIYWPEIYHRDGWCWLKAQCFVESNLRPDAVSPVGARGLCQFLPSTFAEYEQKTGKHGDINNPRDSIFASAWYMAHLLKKLITDREEQCHVGCAQISYNGGFGVFLRAQLASDGGLCYPALKTYLPQETRNYVPRIARWFDRLRQMS